MLIFNELVNIYDFSKAKVKCDVENNPPEILDQKHIHIDIFVPHKFKPYCEFVIPKNIEIKDIEKEIK